MKTLLLQVVTHYSEAWILFLKKLGDINPFRGATFLNPKIHLCATPANLFAKCIAVEPFLSTYLHTLHGNRFQRIKLSQLELMKIHTWPFCSELRPWNYYVPIYVLTFYDMNMDK